MKSLVAVLLRVAALLFVSLPHGAQAACGPGKIAWSQWCAEPMRLAMRNTGNAGLESLLVRPSESARYPLALINHGVPRSGDRHEMTPMQSLPMAIEFARRGYAAAIIMRRGYGRSGGAFVEDRGACANPTYIDAARAGAADLRSAITELVKRPDIDGTRIISVGRSGGGFATVALTADPPRSLVAGISFAGGRGSFADGQICREDRLTDAFRTLGSRSRVPMLWVYAENDAFFGPESAKRFKDAFVAGGGIVDFVMTAPFGRDGHALFSSAGIPIWAPIVDQFLERRGLFINGALLPAPEVPSIAPPQQLSESGRKAFSTYLRSPPHKAFAVSSDGRSGWRSGRRTVDDAKAGALGLCRQHSKECQVVVVDDTPLATQ